MNSLSNRQQVSAYYADHRDELLHYVSSRLGGSWRDAEDLVQDVFVRLLTMEALLSPVTLHALVFTVARNLLNDYFRRRCFRLEFEHYLTCGGPQADTMESVFNATDIVERMERGLAHLPSNCREVYRMHILGGMRVSEISQELGVKYKTIENRLGLARRQMRSYLKAVV